MINEYYRLTKPGIIYGNALTAAAGYFIGIKDSVSLAQFLLILIGISLIVACGCVLNNYIDRDIDAKMERTKNRALVRGAISLHDAAAFGILLGISGVTFLYLANVLALLVALFGLFVYVVIYSIWCKRHTLHATVIGAIAGAVPPVVGYTGATNTLDLGALILFLIIFTWQMPHALAIAIRRFDDYRNAEIPVMPVKRGFTAAKLQMLCYGFAFLLACIALSIAGYAGAVFMWVMSALSVIWIFLCVSGFYTEEHKQWATRVFIFSQIIICAFCVLAAFNIVLP